MVPQPKRPGQKEGAMKKVIGLWIDHREAVVVTLTLEGAETHHLPSNVEQHMRSTGAASVLTAEDMRDRRFTNQLNHFYDALIAVLRPAEALFIFGPGEAKTELKKRLESVGLGDRLHALEAATKLTHPQIVAKVRQHFPA